LRWREPDVRNGWKADVSRELSSTLLPVFSELLQRLGSDYGTKSQVLILEDYRPADPIVFDPQATRHRGFVEAADSVSTTKLMDLEPV
jgi:hypothetical protein